MREPSPESHATIKLSSYLNCCRLRHSSRTSTRTVLGGFNILSQHAFVWTDIIDYTNEATLIVRDRLNMSGIELSSSPAVQVLLTLLWVCARRRVLARTANDLGGPYLRQLE